MEVLLVQLLRLAWIAATLPIIIASIPTPKLNWLRRTLLGFARRGKIMHSSSQVPQSSLFHYPFHFTSFPFHWNCYLQKFTIPQRFFLHFYAVASIWTTFLLAMTWVYAYRMVPNVSESFSYSTITSYLTGGSSFRTGSDKLREIYAAWEAVFLLLLMEVQVLRRLYESIYVFNYSPSARMHILGYLTGMLWVLLSPSLTCFTCYCFLKLEIAFNSVRVLSLASC